MHADNTPQEPQIIYDPVATLHTVMKHVSLYLTTQDVPALAAQLHEPLGLTAADAQEYLAMKVPAQRLAGTLPMAEFDREVGRICTIVDALHLVPTHPIRRELTEVLTDMDVEMVTTPQEYKTQ